VRVRLDQEVLVVASEGLDVLISHHERVGQQHVEDFDAAVSSMVRTSLFELQHTTVEVNHLRDTIELDAMA